MVNRVSLKFVILVILTCKLMFSCDDPRGVEISKKIKQIELGMTKNEVLLVLGEPINELEYKKNGAEYVSLIYEARNRGDSINPTVVLCKNSLRVIAVIVDDSGINDKRDTSQNPCLHDNDLDD